MKYDTLYWCDWQLRGKVEHRLSYLQSQTHMLIVALAFYDERSKYNSKNVSSMQIYILLCCLLLL